MHGQEKDLVFSRIDFDQWVAQGNHTDLPWKVKIQGPELSNEQRLMVTARITIDGKSLANHAPSGELLMLVQIDDGQGHAFQGHGALSLHDLNKDVRQAEIVYTHRALVIPGEYRFTIAMLDTATGGHNLETSTVHVEPLKRDPLIGSWDGLPPVEIIEPEKEPDVFFHPDLTGRLHLTAANRMPVRVELVVEMPNWLGHQFYWTRASLATLMPQLKALSEIELRNGVMNITLWTGTNASIPVTRHGQALDWRQLGSILDRMYYTGANMINVGTHQPPLSQPIVGGPGVNRTPAELLTQLIRNRFADRASGGTEPAAGPLVESRLLLIVVGIHQQYFKGLTWKPEKLNQTGLERVYLIQDYPRVTDELKTPAPGNIDNVEHAGTPDVYVTPPGAEGFPQAVVVYGGVAGPSRTAPTTAKPPWDLRPTLQKTTSFQEIVKSLNPRNFNVKNPAQFREAVGEILKDISRM